MVFPIVGGDGKPTGYDVENSLRFNASDSPQLSKDMSSISATSTKKFTTSFWLKPGNVPQTSYGGIIDVGGDHAISLVSDNTLYFFENGGSDLYWRPTRVFRDPGAWYNIIIIADSTLSTQTDRVKIYVNGVIETSFHNNSGPSQNHDFAFNTSNTRYIGRKQTTSSSLDGYLTEIHHIDGQAKAHTDFGEFDDNGVWVPIEYTGTYGNTGYYLEFKQTGTSQNSSGIGADTSGNDNHFAVSNLAALDVTEDTCTNNFATLVPTLNMTLSEGNVKAMTSRTGNWDGVHASIGLTSGKWYFETKVSNASGTFRVKSGIVGNPETFTILYNGQGTSADPLDVLSNTYPSYGKGVWLSHWYDQNYNTSSTASAQSSGDILQFALDMDNYKMWIGVNGQFKDNSNNNVSYSDVASGSSATVTIASAAYTGKTFFPDVWLRDDDGSFDNVAEINFGNPSFSISSGNTDGKYGNFEYAVPSGFYAICTKRLAEFG